MKPVECDVRLYEFRLVVAVPRYGSVNPDGQDVVLAAMQRADIEVLGIEENELSLVRRYEVPQ